MCTHDKKIGTIYCFIVLVAGSTIHCQNLWHFNNIGFIRSIATTTFSAWVCLCVSVRVNVTWLYARLKLRMYYVHCMRCVYIGYRKPIVVHIVTLSLHVSTCWRAHVDRSWSHWCWFSSSKIISLNSVNLFIDLR